MLVWSKCPGYWWHIYIDTYPVERVSNIVLDETVFAFAYIAGRAVEQTQVYRLRKLPVIGWTYMTGLMQIWQHYRRLAAKRVSVGKEGH